MATLGRIMHELPPAEGNPRNSEGAFLPLRDGRILFSFSRYVSSSSNDQAPANIAAIYSSDEGESWSESSTLFCYKDFQAQNLMSVSLLRMLDGSIGLFMLIRKSWEDCRLHLFRSYDEGKSWSEPVCCIPAKGYYVTNNDRVIRLRSGRLVVCGNFHRLCGWSEQKQEYTIDSRAIAFFFLSDDDGKTWREAQECCYPPTGLNHTGLQESGVIELGDNILWAYMRTGAGCFYDSFSHDGGEHWTPPAPSRFTGPAAPMCTKRLLDGRLIAVWNPVPIYNERIYTSWGWNRTPLALAVSSDNGTSWSRQLFFEDGSEDAGYCYTALFPCEKYLLAAYCAGGEQDIYCLNRIRIRKIPLSEILS